MEIYLSYVPYIHSVEHILVTHPSSCPQDSKSESPAHISLFDKNIVQQCNRQHQRNRFKSILYTESYVYIQRYHYPGSKRDEVSHREGKRGFYLSVCRGREQLQQFSLIFGCCRLHVLCSPVCSSFGCKYKCYVMMASPCRGH